MNRVGNACLPHQLDGIIEMGFGYGVLHSDKSNTTLAWETFEQMIIDLSS